MKSGLSQFLCVVIFFTTLRSEAAPRVALMDFSTDDNSYRSAQTAADFTSLLQVQLASELGVEWVERVQLDKARQELELSTMELMDGGSSIRQGKWVKADWMITGQFSLDDQNHRTLFLEITDLQHADVLVSRTITFQDAATAQFQTASNQVNVAAAAFRQLLTEAHLRQQQTVDKILVAPLFLADVTRNGFSRGSGVLQQGFDDALERAVATNSQVRLVRFPKAYRSLEESEMVLDGLVEADRDAWQHMADLYVWGTYAMTNKIVPGQARDSRIIIDLHLWDGTSQPVIVKGEIPCDFRSGNFPADQAAATLNHLVGQVMAHAHKRTVTNDPASIRKEIAQSLVEAYDQMTNLRMGHRDELGFTDSDKFTQAAHLLETACFFDPDNADTHVLYISCRWGFWINFNDMVKSQFWSKWRHSRAWGKYVERFGLRPVKVDLQFPYQQTGGIPAAYVRSLEDALEMFPQWHSTEEMSLEDEWRKQGVHTWLTEAEFHGFPKDIPHEHAMKWKTELEAELGRRKQKVAEYAQANSTITNNGAGNAVSAAHQTTVVPAPRQISTPQTSSQMIPTPSWAKDMQSFYSMFRLFPPNALPLEVQPNMQEIRFPKQFEVQKIGQLDFLDDKLLILAMDERSSPSSDDNSDVSAEMLDKHNRLWVLKLGEENPTLYEANLFPQSINAFLLEGDRLWVAGKTTGYLNLKTHNFRKFGLADGFDLPISDALGFAGGHIFAAGDNFKVSMFDAAQDRWSNLSLPPANLSGGTGSPFLLAGSRRWLGYVAGSTLIRDFTQNTWTNLANINSIQQILADDSGFWFGGWDGLHLYEPASKSLKHWNAPTTLNGLFVSMMGTSFMGNSEISKGSLERVDGQIQGLLTKFRGNRAKNHATKRERNTGTDPLHLDWRLPGEVTAFANDGEFLWVGVGNYFGDYLLLLHKPSESVVAYCPMMVRDHISSLAISRTSVWIGTAYGDHQLLQLPKDTFTTIPQSRWVSLAISPEERERLVRSMSVRDQAMYAFYAGDDARVAGLLGDTNPEKASLETMMLLAFSYDTLGLDKPEQSRFWFEQIISRYPDSPWAKTAQTALSENEQNHKDKAHEASLLLKYDRNHDGSLDETEKRAMEKDSAYQREEKDRGNEQLNVQLQKIMQRFDLNTDNKLDRGELESLRNQVVMFSEAPSEMLSGRKILVAPLMTKNFPVISTVLKKYDVNGDGALDTNELMALAQDIKKEQ